MSKKEDDPKKGGKADEPTADDIMSSADVKSELAKAKRGDPVHCAVVLTKDKDALLLLDKRKPGKKLRSELKAKAIEIGLEIEMTTMRFGTAGVDAERDAGLVTFRVNKDAPGAMFPRLRDRVKTCGYQKVDIIVDNGLENESDEDEEDGDAKHAEAAIKAAAEKAEQVWDSYIKRWTADFGRFAASAQAAYKDHDASAEVDAFVKTQVTPIIRELTGHALEDKLRALMRSKDPADQKKLLGGAMTTIKALESYVASHPLIHALEDNPFHPIKVGDTASSVLVALRKSFEKLDH